MQPGADLVHEQLGPIHALQNGVQVLGSDVLGSVYAHASKAQVCQAPYVGCNRVLHRGVARVQVCQPHQIAGLHVVPASKRGSGICMVVAEAWATATCSQRELEPACLCSLRRHSCC